MLPLLVFICLINSSSVSIVLTEAISLVVAESFLSCHLSTCDWLYFCHLRHFFQKFIFWLTRTTRYNFTSSVRPRIRKDWECKYFDEIVWNWLFSQLMTLTLKVSKAPRLLHFLGMRLFYVSNKEITWLFLSNQSKAWKIPLIYSCAFRVS